MNLYDRIANFMFPARHRSWFPIVGGTAMYIANPNPDYRNLYLSLAIVGLTNWCWLVFWGRRRKTLKRTINDASTDLRIKVEGAEGDYIDVFHALVLDADKVQLFHWEGDKWLWDANWDVRNFSGFRFQGSSLTFVGMGKIHEHQLEIPTFLKALADQNRELLTPETFGVYLGEVRVLRGKTVGAAPALYRAIFRRQKQLGLLHTVMSEDIHEFWQDRIVTNGEHYKLSDRSEIDDSQMKSGAGLRITDPLWKQTLKIPIDNDDFDEVCEVIQIYREFIESAAGNEHSDISTKSPIESAPKKKNAGRLDM